MSTNLMQASRQWCIRPADERFWTLEELYERSKEYAEQCRVKTLALSDCRVVPYETTDDLFLQGPEKGEPAQFLHYGFGQLCNVAQAPAAYLRELPAPIAADCLNHGMSRVNGDSTLLFHQNGGLHLRCITSGKYSRIWNYEVAEMAQALHEQEGWVTPPARPCGIQGVPIRWATEDDVIQSAHKSLGIRVGDDISPSGLYCSDHDCFIFQVNEDLAIDAGDGEMLYRGVFEQLRGG